jgi:TatD DNase family protein
MPIKALLRSWPARAAGVGHCLSVGTEVESSRANVALARRYPMVRAVIGVHPHEADAVNDETFRAIESLCEEPGVVAIGEVGLDYYRQHAKPEHQLRAL